VVVVVVVVLSTGQPQPSGCVLKNTMAQMLSTTIATIM
jgi:hypothetical protein